MSNYPFPKNFVWGAATSSYQIEGARDLDGKGESIWDRFSHTPGKILNDDHGDVACDHVHRYLDDVSLMRKLGLQAYRFSISWPRILPGGTGQVNSAGLDFYDRLVDALVGAGIRPFITLYHWDLPQDLQDKGGWVARSICNAFAEYAAVVVERLGDRVEYWATINEPRVVMDHGYFYGEHAPGIQDPQAACQVAHHLMLAHGLAIQAMRASQPDLKLGIVLDQSGADPASGLEQDRQAAQRAWQREALYLDLLFKALDPRRIGERIDTRPPQVEEGDAAIIAQTLDYLGLNYYFRKVIDVQGRVQPVPGSEHTAMGWEIYAPGLRNLLNRLDQDYDLPPIYITENGAAFDDHPSQDGAVHDHQRLEYLRQHLIQTWLAMQDGVDVRGYFAWSLFDNFEWCYGYAKRFGIVRVEFETQKRTIKDSGAWYSQVIADHVVSEG